MPKEPRPAATCVDECLAWANRGVDVDVIVSEVRETSRKPDEIYNIIERLAPGRHMRRLELFGRKHNTRPGWITAGNQLSDSRIFERDVVDRLNARYGFLINALCSLCPEVCVDMLIVILKLPSRWRSQPITTEACRGEKSGGWRINRTLSL